MRRRHFRIRLNSHTFFVLGLSFAAGYLVSYLFLDRWLGLPFQVTPLEAMESGGAFSLASWGIYTLLSNILG
jgi:hypothetical protein